MSHPISLIQQGVDKIAVSSSNIPVPISVISASQGLKWFLQRNLSTYLNTKVQQGKHTGDLLLLPEVTVGLHKQKGSHHGVVLLHCLQCIANASLS